METPQDYAALLLRLVDLGVHDQDTHQQFARYKSHLPSNTWTTFLRGAAAQDVRVFGTSASGQR